MEIEVVEPKLLPGVVADEFIAIINDVLSEQGRCSVALSGGSTPGAIYRAMSLPPRVNEIDWSKVSFFLGDERWVPHTDNQSNYKMVHESLLLNLPKPGPKMFPVDTSLATPAASAADYETVIKRELGDKPTFDLMILGLGEDGHCASLFPGTGAVGRTGVVSFALSHPSDGTQRVTLSAETILVSKKIVFLVKGASKAEMVKRVIEGSDAPEVIPSRIFMRAPEKVSWFIDSEAAAQLS